MMFTLTSRLKDTVEINGQEINLDLSFDNVLRLFELADDEAFDENEKSIIAFRMLTRDELEVTNFSIQEIDLIVRKILDEFVLTGKSEPKSGSGKQTRRENNNNAKHYDLEQDAPFIYASFLQDYNIDLLDMQGKLRWEKFIALLSGLRDDTKFKEVVGIRAKEIPKRTKHNKEEVDNLRELKRIYALDNTHADREEELNTMFNILAGKRRNKQDDN